GARGPGAPARRGQPARHGAGRGRCAAAAGAGAEAGDVRRLRHRARHRRSRSGGADRRRARPRVVRRAAARRRRARRPAEDVRRRPRAAARWAGHPARRRPAARGAPRAVGAGRPGGSAMNRRRFLGFLAGTSAALATARAASAQSRQTGRGNPIPVDPPAAPPAATRPVGLSASAPGVTATEVRIGMSAAFRGTAAGLGTEFYRGAQAYYDEMNTRGGVHGRAITVVSLDDNYEPNPCIKNTIHLLEKESVFTLSNYVGTPTLTRALPVIKRYADQSVVLVGNFTGAQPQREAPYADQVFNIRASYRQEMMALVERFWSLGARSFGVFYQIDAYGRSGTDGVARGPAAHARVVPAGPGVAAQLRPRHRRAADLWAGAAPGPRLGVLHARRG